MQLVLTLKQLNLVLLKNWMNSKMFKPNYFSNQNYLHHKYYLLPTCFWVKLIWIYNSTILFAKLSPSSSSTGLSWSYSHTDAHKLHIFQHKLHIIQHKLHIFQHKLHIIQHKLHIIQRKLHIKPSIQKSRLATILVKFDTPKNIFKGGCNCLLILNFGWLIAKLSPSSSSTGLSWSHTDAHPWGLILSRPPPTQPTNPNTWLLLFIMQVEICLLPL